MAGPGDFLREGEQTTLSNEIGRIARSIPGEGLEYALNVLVWLKNHLPRKPHDPNLFRKRTASQILQDGFATGCTDYGLVFVALMRSKGIPATYVEALETGWLRNGGREIHGHVFSGVFWGGRWYLVDPARGCLSVDISVPKDKYSVLAVGLDSWDVGIRSIEDLRQKANKLRKKFEHPS